MSHRSAVHHPRPLAALLGALAVAAAMLVSLVVAPPASATTSAGVSSASMSAEKAFVATINSARASSGRGRLATSSALTSVARAWAQAMADSGRLAHNGRVTAQVKSWTYLGENVGVGQTVPSLHGAFMKSPSHRANVLSPRYSQVGVGVAFGKGRLWVVEVFQKPSSSATASTHRTSTKGTIGYGGRGAAVRLAQRRLHVAADGIFGPKTRKAVVTFQQQHRLKVSRVLDPATRRALRV